MHTPPDPTPPPSAAPQVPRSDTGLQLLERAQWRDSVALTSQPSLRIATVAGMQAALSVLLAVLLVHVSPWPHLVGFAALGALSALFGRFALLRLRMRIVTLCAGLMALGVLIPSLATLAGAGPATMLGVMALVAGAATLVVSHWVLGGPGAVIIVFATGAALVPAPDGLTVAARTLAALAGGAVACATCRATDWLRKDALPHLELPPPVPPPLRLELLVALRITVAAGLSAWVAYLAGMPHPAWAAIGAVAVMQGAHLHITMNRALQRMAGTVVGAVVAWLILAQNPGFGTVLACIVLFQFVTEVVIGFNYALGQIAVTPSALLMTHLAAPAAAVAGMPVERVMDTILGAALGIGFAVLFSTLDDRRQLAQLLARESGTRH
ncbi:FUSC family protein [Comamonas terrigena]|uniref:FUSC family protein n=1 Tax=Comamonas terrigena TaxID=32013 RepID=A0A2A7UZL4_COMTR|nr:FUSC family protein [Comamonas terrigena]PEH90626.1 FUSC family protein [Comamonas terrigena]BBL26016.1 FUSC family protein [Comamonas terrigena NBRC 13299]SUY70419.1 Predicted membrane protein [Comamonas terrigena]